MYPRWCSITMELGTNVGRYCATTESKGNAMISRSLFLNLLVLGFVVVTLAACGDTWEGFKQDTGENVEATGEAVEDAGEAIQQ
jgi:predicted small secreted protein